MNSHTQKQTSTHSDFNSAPARMTIDAVSLIRGHAKLLNNISLDLPAAQLIALLGPNGAGKTSLLNCASAAIKLREGKVLLNGIDVQQLSVKQRARQLAVLPQQSTLNFPFLLKEVIALGRYPHDTGRLVDTAIANRLMQLLHIDNLTDRTYVSLSGGEKQRAQIARVISQLVCNEQLDIYDNSVLLLDEPLAALDMPHQSLLMELLQSLAQKGLTVVVVLHDLNLAAAYADKIALLKTGELIAFDTVDKVVNQAMIEQVYDIEVDIIQHPKTGRPFVLR